MRESTLYQPADRWIAEPQEPQPPRHSRTRTIMVLVLLAALAGVGGTWTWTTWQQHMQAITIPAGTVAVLLDDPTNGAVTTDQVLLVVVDPAPTRLWCTDLGGHPLGVGQRTEPSVCAITDTHVLGHQGHQLIVALPMHEALMVHTLQAAHRTVTMLPWQQAAPHADGQQRMVEPQK